MSPKLKAKILLAITFSLFLMAVVLLLTDHVLGKTDWSDFRKMIAGSLTGSFVGAVVTYVSLHVSEMENPIPEVYGALSSAKILHQQYYARDLVLRLTLMPEANQLSFEICATYVPVKVPCECRILRVTGTKEILGGRLISQHWTLDTNSLDLGTMLDLSTTSAGQTQKLRTRSPGFATFQYLCEFDDDKAYTEKPLFDTHVFKFFCESARVEALLPPGYHLYVFKDQEAKAGHETPTSVSGALHKHVCCMDGAWAPGDSFTWNIASDKAKSANSSTFHGREVA